MKKLLAAMMAIALAGIAQADELADGIKAWEAQNYGAAHQVLGKLAAAGNPEAQLMVGEMYGFGEGVPEDYALAKRWLGKAQEAGHQGAAASLHTLDERNARRQEIVDVVAGRRAGQLTLASYGCVKPVIPPGTQAQSQRDIRAVRDAFDAWSACYQRFGQGLAAQAIPQDLARLMSLGELQQARAAADRADAAVAADSARQARDVVASYNQWATATHNYNIAMEKRLADWIELDRHRVAILQDRQREPVAMAQQSGVK